MKLVFIFVGGGVGSVLRWGLDLGVRRYWPSTHGFPLGILVVNAVGCGAFGLLCGWYGGKLGDVPESLRLLVLTGILGGFTTFSTFSWDTIGLLQQQKFLTAFAYVGLSLMLGLASAAGGSWIGTWLKR